MAKWPSFLRLRKSSAGIVPSRVSAGSPPQETTYVLSAAAGFERHWPLL